MVQKMFSKECDGRAGKTTILEAEIKMVTISKLPWASTTSLSLSVSVSLSLSLSVCLSVCLFLSLSLTHTDTHTHLCTYFSLWGFLFYRCGCFLAYLGYFYKETGSVMFFTPNP